MPLPLIPIIVGVFLSSVSIYLIHKAFRNAKNIGILGMQGAGKTRFLCYIRGVEFVEKATGRDLYDDFTYTSSDGKERKIRAGVDIGGSDTYRSSYNDIIKNSDYILYFFDITKYIKGNHNDKLEYQRDCNSRFDHIYSYTKETEKFVIIIASHKDHYGGAAEEIQQKFDELIKEKVYKDLFKHTFFVNLTDEKEIKELADKIFNRK